MKYLQIFVISLLIALSLAQRERKGGFRNKKFPRPPKLCSTDGDCPNTATCLNPESKPNGICVPKKKADMFKKLRGCSADSDCEGTEKCREMPKVEVNMCMSEALTKVLQKKERLPGVPKSCVSESDCSGAAKCVDFPKFNKQLCLVEDRHLHRMLMIIHQNFEMKDKDNLGIDDKKEKDGKDNKDKESGVDFDKKKNMFKKMISELRGCAADSDCEGAMKCKELPKVGINMCMSEALSKMLEMKVARLPGVPKSCVSESDCSGAAKCVDFPKFNKQLCLVEDRHLHRMLMILHQNFEMKDKDNLGIDENKEKDGEDNKDKDSGVDLDKKTDDSKKDLNYEKDNIDLFISDPQLIKRKNDDRFISDPQFRKRKHGDKGEFGFSKSDDEHHMRNNPWRMFFLGALAMTGVVIIMLTVVMCCLKFRKRSLPGDAAPEEQDTKRNHLRHNAFLTKISTVSHNPYSKLHNEKV